MVAPALGTETLEKTIDVKIIEGEVLEEFTLNFRRGAIRQPVQ